MRNQEELKGYFHQKAELEWPENEGILSKEKRSSENDRSRVITAHRSP